MLNKTIKVKALEFGKLAKYLLIIGIVAFGLIYLLIDNTKTSQAATDQTITDQNADGIINLVDARILAPPAVTNCPVCVDVNSDRTINQKDFDLVQSYIDQNAKLLEAGAPEASYKPRFDINADGKIDTDDMVIIKNYFGQVAQEPVFGLGNPQELTFGFMANDILIKFKPGTTDSQKQTIFTKYNLSKKRSFDQINTTNLATPDVNVENLQKQLAQEPVVQSTTKNYLGEWATDDPYWDDQWGHQKIRIEQTWYTETQGRTPNKVRVAVIDTGADYSHYDLGQNLSQTLRRNVEIDPSWGFEQQDVTDENGHGTFMAGIIGATANNGQGIAGLNWNVEIIPIKIPTNVYGQPILSWIYVALEWTAMNHEDIDVVNMSFGFPDRTSDENMDYYLNALDSFGVILVAAAGNLGRDDSEYPANHPKVVSVGATLANDLLCPDSSGRTSADIFAPGDYIFSTVPIELDWIGPQDGVAYYGCGTSAAAAYVSGVAALCRVVAPVSPSRDDLKCNKFEHNGFGRIDAWASVWYKNCSRFDFNGNGEIGVIDARRLARAYNTSSGDPLYNVLYDIAPVGTDGQISIADALLILNRQGFTCQ